MISSNALSRNSVLFLLLCTICPTISGISYTLGDYEYSFYGSFKPETFFGKNLSLFNNNLPEDKIVYQRHTLDLNWFVNYGQKTYGSHIVRAKFNIRDKAIWGNPGSITPTTETETKILSSVGRPHKHFIPRHLFWMREAWLDVSLNEFLGLGFAGEHRFMFGAFPFELGRGIALGSAFAVGHGLLGFYSDSAIDQYAFGAKIGGELMRDDVLTYDFYAAVLQNKSSSLSETAENVRGQEIGRIKTQERGFGVINYIAATRLVWTAFDTALGTLTLEPYALYNSDPEQQIEFLGDASSKLGTLGLACEYACDTTTFGFDYAINVGRQLARGWDRNQIQLENRAGSVVEVNSHVRVGSASGAKALFKGSGSAEQKIIDSTYENETQNGKAIGTVSGSELFNASNRFSNLYKNTYKGWMFVIDADKKLYKDDLKGALAAGIASGDDNPNLETIDHDYTGFIGLQEIYSGKRVRSAFVLGGAGKIKRPLSTPETDQAPNPFPLSVSGFTNLVFAGAALTWEPENTDKKGFKLNPNALIYWQDKPIKKFDAVLQKDLDANASTFLGVEANVFFDYKVTKDLTFYLVGSLFFPGQLYVDITGKPLTPAQQRALDLFNTTGASDAQIPNIGHDTAFTFNAGFSFKF